MSTALTANPASHNQLPARAQPVALSPSLAYYVAGERISDGHLSPTMGRPSAEDIKEARRALQESERQCVPADPRRIARWMLRMTVLPFGPSGEDASQQAIAAICLACRDVPVAAISEESSILALQTWKHWPAPAEVYALLSEQARPFSRTRDGLRRVLATEPPKPTPEREPRTQEAIAHVREVVRGFTAEVAARRETADPRDRSPAKPGHLSERHLLQTYRKAAAEGDPRAAARLTILEKKMTGQYAQ